MSSTTGEVDKLFFNILITSLKHSGRTSTDAIKPSNKAETCYRSEKYVNKIINNHCCMYHNYDCQTIFIIKPHTKL